MVFSLDSSGLSQYVSLDDPEYPLSIERSSDFKGYRSHAREKEPWTYDWLKDFDEDVLLFDIGACVGSYSLMAAARGAHVVAFEPLPVNARALERNINLNNLAEHITPVQVAIGEPGDGVMHVHQELLPAGYGLGSLTDSEHGKSAAVEVSSISLDAAANLYGMPTHIKVDVEGGELDVFSPDVTFGLMDHVQSVIIEIADDDNEKQIDTMLGIHGFTGREVGVRRTMDNRTKIYDRGSDD